MRVVNFLPSPLHFREMKAENNKKAFTLVELIVVITILLVLGTISFLAYQSFSKEARDSKRVSDTRNLLNKVSILEVKGTSLNDLVSSYEDGENIKENSLTFNAQSGKIGYQGKVNFDKLGEVETNFQDPKAKVNYPFVVSKGTLEINGKTESYSFQQIAYVSERDGKTKLVGNYFKYQDGDSPSLFVSDGTTGTNIPGDYYVDDDEDQIYELEEKDPPTTCPGGYYLPNGRKKCLVVGYGYYRAEADSISQRTKCEGNKTTPTNTSTSASNCSECIDGYTGSDCETEIVKSCASPAPSGDGIQSINEGTPTSINQARKQGTSGGCYYICKDSYSGDNCETFTFTRLDITITNGTDSITIMDRNLGAKEAGTGTNSYGDFYQWGNNKARPSTGNVSWINSPVSTLSYGLGVFYTDDGSSLRRGTRNDWSSNQNDNLWGGTGGTLTQRQGPCPDGYHIPTGTEWNELIKIWFASKSKTCNVSAGSYCSWTGSASLTNFRTELKMSFVGNRNQDQTTPRSQESYGNYRSSSPNGANAYYLDLGPSNVYPQNNRSRMFAFSVRCFKN